MNVIDEFTNEAVISYNLCDSCGKRGNGVLYLKGRIKVLFECSTCNPKAYKKELNSKGDK